ncbi:[protein-PII] uridylyltransferase [Alginatibacterium sediminis]|uniref:Bifunctional uridylyltransferase/uridylyl-removing enzyme n=1 Tax=Alginatibacterium sediminis TaxID=2164068 RepID=A0A420E876_9ALTE|nr:[protein-PII] uridylyltransferase [Alginatibacterium sediminis]RKF15514.1 [protein-PII] uridylyltransferase [Alginatibacterium sediminis]
MEVSINSPCLEDYQTPSIKDCKQFLSDDLEWSENQFDLGVNVYDLVLHRAAQMDLLLVQLWQDLGLAQHDGLSLIAVGGYGRGELHPHSDIDILVLTQDALPPKLAESLSAFITLLWDLRLDVGQSVRTLQECLELGSSDITIATNLQESRLLTGNETHYIQLQLAVSTDEFWSTAAFFEAKKSEQQQRHQQHNDNAYSLEPDIKGNLGGLRDIQTICWVAGRHFGSSDIDELAKHGFLTLAESRELQDCRDFLWRVRFALHLGLNKADDRLLFDRQTSVAQRLGYSGKFNAPVERLMKHFFQTVRRVTELNEMLLQLFDEAILGNTAMDVRAIDDNFNLRGNLIASHNKRLFLDQPEQILQLFLHIADNEQVEGVYSSTLRQLREARRRLTHWLQDDPECRRLFRKLIKHPRFSGIVFTLMHRYGVMSAYFPAWSRIVGQMQFDLFHAFTVDEHTHRLIKNIDFFSNAASAADHPLCHQIYPRLERPDLLLLAALFHDIAKGRQGDHSSLGAVDALDFCLAHGFSQPSARLVAWLVQNHLVMSVTAQRRDIYDPDVIHEFANLVRDQRRLDMLLCLTVADIRATNDDTWNSWKRSLLGELYHATQKALRRGLEKPVDLRGMIRDKKLKAKALLAHKGYSEEQILSLWSRFRPDYFLRHTPEQITWHSDHLWGHSPREPLVLISKRATRGGTEIFIHSKDIDHLFASVAATLDQRNLTILDAQVMASRDGFAIDTFVVLEPDGQAVTGQRAAQVRQALVKMLHFAHPIDLTPRRTSRQMQQFSVKPKIEFLPTRGKRTLLELVALDKPGLLARISSVFQKLDFTIHAAKVTTIGEKAEDFFSVSNSEREALNDEERSLLKTELERQLNL